MAAVHLLLLVTVQKHDNKDKIIFFVYHEVPNCISHSSSSTILAYGSNTLFLSSSGSNSIYTISSYINSTGVGQTLAVGKIEFPGISSPRLRDIAVTSPSLQSLRLPSGGEELHHYVM